MKLKQEYTLPAVGKTEERQNFRRINPAVVPMLRATILFWVDRPIKRCFLKVVQRIWISKSGSADRADKGGGSVVPFSISLIICLTNFI